MLENKVLSIILIVLLGATVIAASAPDSFFQVGEVPQVQNVLGTNDSYQQQSNQSEIPATIDIVPNTLNLKSNGKWITCFIELPVNYNASDINASTILLNNNLTPVLDQKYGFVKNQNLEDHNGNNISERKFKFDRQAVHLLVLPGGSVNITITGKLYNNQSFNGTDVVRVKNPPGMKNKTKIKDDFEPDNETEAGNETNDNNQQNPDNGTNQQQTNNTNISANVKIVPVSINLKSEGNWITCFIELPDGYNASQINASSVLMNGNLSPVLDTKYGFVSNESEYLTDDDSDGRLERMFKFDRSEVQDLLSDAENKEWVELTITGKVNGSNFEGSDTVRVINK
jgi:hypothetical protein